MNVNVHAKSCMLYERMPPCVCGGGRWEQALVTKKTESLKHNDPHICHKIVSKSELA